MIFDAGEKTFRNEIYKEYKANRPPPPEDLIPQFPLVRDATRAFGVSLRGDGRLRGRRPDRDLCAAGARSGARCTIISSDKDLMQLVVDGKVEMLDTMKNRRLASRRSAGEVRRHARQGGACPGAGRRFHRQCARRAGHRHQDRGRADQQYGDLETLLKRAGEIKQNKRRETLIENAENARISLKLVTLDANVPIKEKPDEFAVHEPDCKELIAFLKAMEFTSITKRVAAHYEVEDLDAIAAAPTVANVLPPRAGIAGRWQARPRPRRRPARARSTTMPMSR